LLNTVGQRTLVQRHLVTVSGPGCTLTDIYVWGIKADTVTPQAVSSITHPFYRVLGHGSFVAQKASSLWYNTSCVWELKCSTAPCISEPTWVFLFAYCLIPCVPGLYDRHDPMKWLL
jgi:hypothetical protein